MLIVLVIKLFLPKQMQVLHCFLDSTQRHKTKYSSCMNLLNCVVRVIVHFLFDRVLICKYMTGSSWWCLPLQETAITNEYSQSCLNGSRDVEALPLAHDSAPY